MITIEMSMIQYIAILIFVIVGMPTTIIITCVSLNNLYEKHIKKKYL